MDYPVILERDDNDTILVSFPDFPEAHTFGDTAEEALRHATDALATVIDGYIKSRRDIPLPSAVVARHHVAVPSLIEAKIRLYETMRSARINKAALARRLNWHQPQVDRLLAMTHGSKLDQLDAAFRVMGKRLTVSVVDVPQPSTRHERTPAKRRTTAQGRQRATAEDRTRKTRSK